MIEAAIVEAGRQTLKVIAIVGLIGAVVGATIVAGVWWFW